jgi:hypothetical protein
LKCYLYLKNTISWGICLGQGSSFADYLIKCTHDDEESRKQKPKKRKTPEGGETELESHKDSEPVVITEPEVIAYSDANHGTGVDEKKSISGAILQVYGGPVIWSSKMQPCCIIINL